MLCAELIIDEGGAISVHELISKKDKFKTKDQIFSYLKENYLLGDIKKKFLHAVFLREQ